MNTITKVNIDGTEYEIGGQTTPATKDKLGIVQIGDNIDVDENGVISVNLENFESQEAILGYIDESRYYGMLTPVGSDVGWIRTTKSGLLPYAIDNTSKIGTANWKFSEGHFATMFATSIYTGSKTSASDGVTGVFLSPNGRIQLQNTTGNPYITFYGPDATDHEDCYISYNITNDNLSFGGATLYSFGNSVYSSGTIRSADAIYSGAGLYLGYNDDWSNARSIVIPFKDGNYHSLVYRGTDGLSVTLGWGGSSSYKTTTYLSGYTVKYSNSSGNTTLSDERLKKDFTELDRWDGFFDSIKPCAFKMKNGASGRFHIGFKAQQIEEALLNSGLSTSDFAGFVKMAYEPNLDDEERTAVYEAAGIKPGDDEYGLIYSEFTALNTYEIQKLKKRIDDLEALVKEKDNEREAN